MRNLNVTWNIIGLALPLLVAAITVPHLVSVLGQERFGLLALAWGLIGYAGSLDLGIGRALTQRTSQLLGSGQLLVIPIVLATAERLTLCVGLLGGFGIAVAAMLGAATWIEAPNTPPAEVTAALFLLAIALPAQAMTATFRGLNEAFLNFKSVNLLRVCMGVVTFGGPYLVSYATVELPWLVATLVGGRIVGLVFYRKLAHSCLRSNGADIRLAVFSSTIARSLLAFGGWVSISGLIAPLMMQADRFLIATTLSASAVTAYVLPYEVVVQSLILVGAISTVVFPTLSKMIIEKPDTWRPYFLRWLGIVTALMTFVCSFLAIIISDLLNFWITTEVGAESIQVGQILCIGVFANAIGAMYYALLHAKGRSDITAKLHILELPLFLGALCILLDQYGIVGAAWAWVGRMIIDASALAYMSNVDPPLRRSP